MPYGLHQEFVEEAVFCATGDQAHPIFIIERTGHSFVEIAESFDDPSPEEKCRLEYADRVDEAVEQSLRVVVDVDVAENFAFRRDKSSPTVDDIATRI